VSAEAYGYTAFVVVGHDPGVTQTRQHPVSATIATHKRLVMMMMMIMTMMTMMMMMMMMMMTKVVLRIGRMRQSI